MYRPKKTALKPFLEIDPEDHAEAGSEDDCKGYIGEDLAVGAFHGVPLMGPEPQIKKPSPG